MDSRVRVRSSVSRDSGSDTGLKAFRDAGLATLPSLSPLVPSVFRFDEDVYP